MISFNYSAIKDLSYLNNNKSNQVLCTNLFKHIMLSLPKLSESTTLGFRETVIMFPIQLNACGLCIAPWSDCACCTPELV